MLDARYIHLHEALGLGAMWLKNGAQTAAQTDGAEKTLPERIPQNLQTAADSAEKTLPEKMPQKPPAAAVAPDHAADNARHAEKLSLALRAAYAVASDRKNPVFWLSLSPALNENPQQALGGGSFARLLAQLFISAGQGREIYWHKLPVDGGNWTDVCLGELERVGSRRLVVLGEDIERCLNFSAALRAQHSGIDVLVLPHPLQMMRRAELKAAAWQKLAAFLR